MLTIISRIIYSGATRIVENITFEPNTRGRALEEVENLRNELIQDYAWILG